MTGEEELIDKIKALAGPPLPGCGVVTGIGDDCAVFECDPGAELAASTDAFVEDVHFRRAWLEAEEIGFLAAAGAASDLAAMAARPRWLLLSLKLPPEAFAMAQAIVAGTARLCRETGMTLAGGNLSRDTKISLDTTVLGQVGKGRALLRSGAKEGDEIWVTGQAGRGLSRRLWLEGGRPAGTASSQGLFPVPRHREAEFLNDNAKITAMTDTSDGLARDLWHICRSSGLGARVKKTQIPVCPHLATLCRTGRDLALEALYGGEDYELCFCAVPGSVEAICKTFAAKFPETWLTPIGTVERQKALNLDTGTGTEAIPPSGFDHFA